MSELFNLSSWLLERHLDSGHGERVAIRAQGRSLSYADLFDESQAAAAAFRELGLRPEERVVLALRDAVELAAAFLGAIRVGVIPVLVNPLLPARDIAAIVALARARATVHDAAIDAVELAEGAPELELLAVVGSGAAALESPAERATSVRWESTLARDTEVAPHATWPDSPAFWLCTSGTTGRPKLVMHRQLNALLTTETYAARVLEIDERDRCYSAGPLFHAYGLGNSLTFPLAVGASAVLDPTRPLSPQVVEEIVRTEEPTLFFGIPTLYAALLAAELPEGAFDSVRRAVSAAEPLPAETWRGFRDRFGVEILDGIGSTEALHIFISNRAGEVRPGTSGTPVPGYEARLVDDHGDGVEADAVGQLEIRGDSFASGYWCDTRWTRHTFQGEWLRTGDLYSRSGDGYYTYLGRSDDMLRVSGEWVSPAEVEGVLIEHAAVLEAAVVGEGDELGAQRPLAYVTLVAGEEVEADELREFCRARLAGYKRPRRVVIVDELPKTTTGKIQRFRLRAGPEVDGHMPGAAPDRSRADGPAG